MPKFKTYVEAIGRLEAVRRRNAVIDTHAAVVGVLGGGKALTPHIEALGKAAS